MSIVQQLLATYSATVALTLTSTASTIKAARQAYSQTNVAHKGIPNYTYSITAGSVPAGTSLNTSTGTVSGTPTTAGAFSYGVTATDASLVTVTNTVSGTISAVVGGSSTFISGSGNFTIPPFNTLTVQLWGPGGGGDGVSSPITFVAGNAGGTTSVGALGLSATSGAGGLGAVTGSAAGGTGSGGTTNATGGAGGAAGGGNAFGHGGAGADGGAGGAAAAAAPGPGNAGTAPGGGGGGAANVTPANEWGHGGGGGGFCQKAFAAGSLTVGGLLAWVVGAGGAGGAAGESGGAGAHGQVKFIWS